MSSDQHKLHAQIIIIRLRNLVRKKLPKMYVKHKTQTCLGHDCNNYLTFKIEKKFIGISVQTLTCTFSYYFHEKGKRLNVKHV